MSSFIPTTTDQAYAAVIAGTPKLKAAIATARAAIQAEYDRAMAMADEQERIVDANYARAMEAFRTGTTVELQLIPSL